MKSSAQHVKKAFSLTSAQREQTVTKEVGFPPIEALSRGKRAVCLCRRDYWAKMARMPTKPEDHVVTAQPSPFNDYDMIAEGYAAENETSLPNAYYERPAMLELA